MSENESKKLSAEPYKGTRDFYPEEMALQKYIFSVMRSVAERYGYVEYGASILEESAIYQAKTGSEIVNEQTYSFTDRGDREVTIRPEMTPTVARMVARKRKELSFPLRWYSIPNLLRYERPQRGRLREHWQLNVDMFGIDSIEADAEVVTMAYDIMKAFGAKDDQFVIRLNSRKLMNNLISERFGLDKEAGYALAKLIDRKDKMPENEFASEAEKLLGDEATELRTFLRTKSISEISNDLKGNEGVKDLEALEAILGKRGIKNYIFDPSLMRGFDYYTGTVFEVFNTDPAAGRSLFGGGRYDDLVSIFGVEKVSGVGFGMGDVTIADFIEAYGLVPKLLSTTRLYICVQDKKSSGFADELASHLRKNGVNTAVDYTDRKIASQIKTAEKGNIPFIVCIGEEEERSRAFKVKNLEAHKETEVSWNDLPDFIKRG
jgi:histidyl-tRNA synthetase